MFTFYQNLLPQIPKKYRNKLMLQWWAIKQIMQGRLRLRNTFGDVIKISDQITCYNGEKVVFRTKGHITNYGMIAMVNWLSWTASTSQTAYYGLQYSIGTYMYIRCGTGHTNPTTATTTALDAINATAPSSFFGATSNPSAGSYRITWTATWNAGSLTAITIYEFGMWWNNAWATSPTQFALQSYAMGSYGSTAASNAEMVSRISDPDGDFSHFTVNTSVPLTLQWSLTFTFA
jgi:hypothetical protein